MAKNDILIQIGLKGHEKFKSKLKDAATSMRRAGRLMKENGRQMTQSITLPIVAIGAASVKMGIDFENSMNKIVGQVGIAREEVNGMRRDFERVARNTGKSMTELGDAMFFVQSAGLRGSDAVDALEISAKASAAGMGQTKVIADLLTSAINAYGSANLSAAEAGDILSAAVREGKAEASAMAASMGQVLPIASEMGVSFDQVAAAQAAMTRTGTDAATASTQLRQILFTLKDPSSEARTQLDEMNISAAGLRRQIREEGLLRTLQTLSDTFGDNEEATAKVFGNVRALSGVLDLMGANADENAQIFMRMADANGSLATAFAETNGTGRLLNQIYAELQILLISLYDSISEFLTPALEVLRNALRKATDFWRGMSDEAKSTVVLISGVVAAIGPLLMVLGSLKMALAAATFALAGLVSPVGLVVAALAALATAVAYVYSNWEAIIERISDIDWWRNALIKMQQLLIEYSPINLIIKQVNNLIEFFGKDPIPNPFEMMAEKLEGLKTETKDYEHDMLGFGSSIKKAIGDAARGMGLLGDATKKTKDELEKGAKAAKKFGQSTTTSGSTSNGSGAASSNERLPGAATLDSTVDIKPVTIETTLEAPNVSSWQSKLEQAIEGVKGSLSSALDTVGEWMPAIQGVFDLWGSGLDRKAEKQQEQYQAELERIQNSKMSEEAKERAIAKLNKEREKEEKKMAREKAKRDKAQGIFQAIIAGATAVVQALPNIVLAAIVGGIAATQVAAIASEPLPALAEGGLAYGPTQALVGDNPNAGIDPEVISPLSKLKKYMGGGDQRVTVGGAFRIDGQDLLYVIDENRQIQERR